jgi:hypothetical protein
MHKTNRQDGAAGRRGLSLAELLVALVVIAACAASMAALLVATCRTAGRVEGREAMLRAAEVVLARITEHVQGSDVAFLPNARRYSCPVLAVNLRLDNDGDGQIDEDPARGGAGPHGVAGQDDDGDGFVDEGTSGDADEDGLVYEDPANGTDDDGDGLVDEDFSADANGDSAPGVVNQDDDGDGQTDEGDDRDDDEDGAVDEDGPDPVVYALSGSNLVETHPQYGANVLAGGVSEFTATLLVDDYGTRLVEVTIELTDANGNRVRLSTRIFPRGQQGAAGAGE